MDDEILAGLMRRILRGEGVDGEAWNPYVWFGRRDHNGKAGLTLDLAADLTDEEYAAVERAADDDPNADRSASMVESMRSSTFRKTT